MKKIILLSLILIGCSKPFAQNALTLNQCEDLFQKNNLLLLAEQYNIEASKAAVIQARIWDQPVVSGEFNLVNPQNKRAFDIGNAGEKAFAIQQLIYLGGKKRKEVEFAKSNVVLAELQYEQLLRSLKFQIHQSFYEIHFNQAKANSIYTQLRNLDTLINAYSTQAQKGNVPLKDVVRLQSLSLSFKNDLLDIQKIIFANQENLKILLNSNANIKAMVSEENLTANYGKNINFLEEQLQNKALEKNPEYLSTLKIMESTELLVKWQKSLAVPDLTLGANYDQQGGAFKNQVDMTFAIPLPLWNKNKGNIKVAQAQLSQSKLMKDEKGLELKSKVSTALYNLLYQQKQYQQTTPSFENFETVYKGILQNFQKRNISLIEFTDFMESYNQSTLFFNEIKKELLISGETLNYLTNEKVF